MAFSRISYAKLWSSHALTSATDWVLSLVGMHQFTPEESLSDAKNVDPRLVPKVHMQSGDIDANLLLELSKLGMKHGKLVSAESHPELMQAWQVMSHRAGLAKTPQLIIVDSKTINAMTVSPEEVVMTTGLLKKLDFRQTCAVLGHELGHAVSDHKRPRIAATVLFGGAGVYAGYKLWDTLGVRRWTKKSNLLAAADEFIFMSLGFSFGSMLGNQISVRPTELQADLKGAAISGDPEGLISALQALEAGRKHSPLRTMIGYLHSGYPTTEQRIANLRKVASHMPPVALAAPITVAPQAQQLIDMPSPKVSAIAADARIEAAPEQIALN